MFPETTTFLGLTSLSRLWGCRWQRTCPLSCLHRQLGTTIDLLAESRCRIRSRGICRTSTSIHKIQLIFWPARLSAAESSLLRASAMWRRLVSCQAGWWRSLPVLCDSLPGNRTSSRRLKKGAKSLTKSSAIWHHRNISIHTDVTCCSCTLHSNMQILG